jgi:hypothetical protein
MFVSRVYLGISFLVRDKHQYLLIMLWEKPSLAASKGPYMFLLQCPYVMGVQREDPRPALGVMMT